MTIGVIDSFSCYRHTVLLAESLKTSVLKRQERELRFNIRSSQIYSAMAAHT